MGQPPYGPNGRDDDRDVRVRTGLRVAGVVLTVIALVLVVVGLVDFFGAATAGLDATGSTDGPKHFWVFFLALPMLAAGFACLRAGFLGAALGFVVRESAPAVRRFGEALGTAPTDTPGVGGAASYCPSCGVAAGPGARFCASCGHALGGNPLP